MKNLLLLTTLTLCLSLLATSCGEDDSFTVEELGPAFLEVTQDSFTFRFWLENEAGEVTNVFSKEEHFVFAWSVINNQKIGRWVDITSNNFKNYCSVYKDDEFIYGPSFVSDDLLRIHFFMPEEIRVRKRTVQRDDEQFPNLKKGKYYTLLEPNIYCYKIDTLNGYFMSEYVGSIEYSELRINFGVK